MAPNAAVEVFGRGRFGTKPRSSTEVVMAMGWMHATAPAFAPRRATALLVSRGTRQCALAVVQTADSKGGELMFDKSREEDRRLEVQSMLPP